MSIIKNYQSAKGTCKVTFSYPLNEGVKSVKILGDFNNWDSSNATNMKKSKTDFNAVVELKAGAVYEFRYLLDDANWDNDHNADRYVSSPFNGVNNSVIVLDEVVSAPKAQAKKAVAAKPVVAKAKIVKEAVKTTPAAKTVEKKAAAPKKVAEVKVAKEKVTKEVKPAVKKVEKEAKPAAKKVAKVSADDLKKIEGIGPKIAELLNKKNIVTFADLSKAKVDTLKAILVEAGAKFQMHDPSTWAQQATLAAKGNWDELKKLQDVLTGGKK